jgi:hypothetical protein
MAMDCIGGGSLSIDPIAVVPNVFKSILFQNNEALTIMSYRTGRSLVSGGNEMVVSVHPPMRFQYGTIEFSQSPADSILKGYRIRDPAGIFQTASGLSSRKDLQIGMN